MPIVKITSENFENEVVNSDKPVLIDFWASWCTPCKMLSPIIDEIADETVTAKICKINVDEEPELASNFKVMNIPMLAVIKDGSIVDTKVGVQPKEIILKMIED